MTLDEIKDAVKAGKRVHWKSRNYTVICDLLGQWMIAYNHGSTDANYIGLTWRDGTTMNGEESEFFIGATA